MKWVKRLLLVLGIVVLLVVGGVAAFVMTFNPNAYKGQIEQLVKARTGRTLTLAGNMQLAIFPRLGLRLNDVTLSNPTGFGTEPFARLSRASLYVELMPLLQHRLVVDKVVINGLDLALRRNAQGVANWVGLAGPSAARSASPKQQSSPAAAAAGAPFALAVAGVEVRNARVTWTDAVDGTHVVLAPLNLSVGRLAPGQAAPLKLSFHIENTKPAMGIDATLTAQLSADLSKGSYALSNIAFNANAKGSTLPNGEVRTSLGGNLSVDTAAAGRMQFSGLDLKVNQTQVTGSMSVSDFARPAIRFALHSPSLDLDRLLAMMGTGQQGGNASAASGATASGAATNANTPIPLPVASLRSLNLAGKINVDKVVAQKLKLSQVSAEIKAANGVLSVAPVSASLYGGTLKADTTVNVQGPQPRYTAVANLQQVQIGNLLKDYAGDAYMTGVARLSADLNATGETVNALTRALSGRMAIAVNNGSFQHSKLAQNIQTLMEALQQTKPGPQTSTQFASLTATAQVRSGVIDNRDLLLNAIKFKATGSGTADLVNRHVNYVLNFSKAQGKGAIIPLKIHGPFKSLNYNIDFASMARQAAESKVQQELNKQKQKLQQELKKSLPKSLQGLF